MTAFDRFESRLPELMTELAVPGTPDYFESMLQATARTSQRPAWRSLERWIPMGVIARTNSIRSIPLRPVVVAVLVLALAAAALLLYAGSRAKLPPPFGPARNGMMLMATSSRDIVAVDPVTGATRPVLTGAGVAVQFSPTGQVFFYDRSTTPSPDIYVANADGSGAHQVWVGPDTTTSLEWTQDGRSLITASADGSGTKVTLIDAGNGSHTTIRFDQAFDSAQRPMGGTRLLLTAEDNGPASYYLADADGSNLRMLPIADGNGWGSLSPDGGRFAYTTWGDGFNEAGRTHVLDLATGATTQITGVLPEPYSWLDPVFSPDGASLAIERFGPDGYVIAIASIADRTITHLYGEPHQAYNIGAPTVWFSPDGTQLFVRYADDRTVWLYDVASGKGHQLPWATEFITWQRASTE